MINSSTLVAVNTPISPFIEMKNENRTTYQGIPKLKIGMISLQQAFGLSISFGTNQRLETASKTSSIISVSKSYQNSINTILSENIDRYHHTSALLHVSQLSALKRIAI